VWKPLHLQPAFAGLETVGGDVGSGLFERGLFLPSGSNLSAVDQERVIEIVRRQAQGPI
jgi:dTDP-4-amino-4,6-dideoxygalactose transaminase